MTHTGEEVFNLGTGKGCSVLELVKAFETASGIKIPYVISGRRPGDLPTTFSDSSKSEEMLGWKAVRPLDDTLRSAWQWQQNLAKKK